MLCSLLIPSPLTISRPIDVPWISKLHGAVGGALLSLGAGKKGDVRL
jgi:hypothetical protein